MISPGKYAFNNVFMMRAELLGLKEQLYIVPHTFHQDPDFLGFSKKYNQQAFLKKFNRSMKKGR